MSLKLLELSSDLENASKAQNEVFAALNACMLSGQIAQEDAAKIAESVPGFLDWKRSAGR